MTLRAYRPDDVATTGAPRANDQLAPQQNEWQNTLLDRPLDRGTGRQSAQRANYNATPPRSRIWWLTGLFALAALAVTGYFVVQGRSGGNSIPLVTADSAPYKVQPEQPGGADIPFKDKLVFNRLDPNGQPVQAEKLLPPPEEPNAAKTAPSSAVMAAAPATQTVTTTTTVAPAPKAAPATAVQSAPVTAVVQTPAPTTTPKAAPATAVTSEATTTQTPVQRMVAANQPKADAAAPAANPKTGTTAPVATTTTTTSVTTQVAAPAAAPKPVSAPATVSSAASGQVRIQLASIPDQANAEKALPQLSGKFASALGGTHLSLVKADIAGKGTYWRVQSQPLDRAKADSACSAIKAQGGVCIIAK